MGSLVRVQLSPPLGSLCKSIVSAFLSPRHHRRGFAFFRAHLGDVNNSSRRTVHTAVWLSCRKIGVDCLMESRKRASPKCCSGDALNLINSRFSRSSIARQIRILSSDWYQLNIAALSSWFELYPRIHIMTFSYGAPFRRSSSFQTVLIQQKINDIDPEDSFLICPAFSVRF